MGLFGKSKEPEKDKKEKKEPPRDSGVSSRPAADEAQIRAWRDELAIEKIRESLPADETETEDDFPARAPDLTPPQKRERDEDEVDRGRRMRERAELASREEAERAAREEADRSREEAARASREEAARKEREEAAARREREETARAAKDSDRFAKEDSKLREEIRAKEARLLKEEARLTEEFRLKEARLAKEEARHKEEARMAKEEALLAKEEARLANEAREEMKLREAKLAKEEDRLAREEQRLKDDARSVRRETEMLQEKVKSLTDQIVRLQADFSNFRTRTEKEKTEAIRFGREATLEKLIGLTDVLEDAIRHSQNASDVDSLKKGFEMVIHEFLRMLRSEGAEPIEAIGKKFDPDLHEAVDQVETDDERKNDTILEEIQKGYTANGRLLRPAKVRVAKYRGHSHTPPPTSPRRPLPPREVEEET